MWDRHVRKLDKITAQLVDVESAREILRAKGYGATGMTASTTAAQVPISNKAVPTRAD